MHQWDGGNGLYFQLNQPIQPFNAFLYRTIKSMKDYNGGRNQWLDCDLFAAEQYEKLIEMLLEVQTSSVLMGVERRAA